MKSSPRDRISHRFWRFRCRFEKSLCSRRRAGVKSANTTCRFAGTLTGATGLEPATSGVTGRYAPTGYSRLRPGITGYSRHFLAEPTGCDRLRPAAARQSLCDTCVVDMVPTSTTALGATEPANVPLPDPGDHSAELRLADHVRPPRTVDVRWQRLAAFLAPVERSEEHTSELPSRGHLVCRL